VYSMAKLPAGFFLNTLILIYRSLPSRLGLYLQSNVFMLRFLICLRLYEPSDHRHTCSWPYQKHNQLVEQLPTTKHHT
jgi:hypothetical protein